jgi:hypothetical protein
MKRLATWALQRQKKKVAAHAREELSLFVRGKVKSFRSVAILFSNNTHPEASPPRDS